MRINYFNSWTLLRVWLDIILPFSKTVADLKVRFPSLQEGMKGLLSSEMEKVVREEKFLKEEPERLESALRRCKKLTGTLVTLKRYDFLLLKYYWHDDSKQDS